MTDRNLRRSAVIGLVITAVLTAATMGIGGLDLLSRTWSVRAEFANAADLKQAAPVRVAGVRVGTVSSIERDVERDRVVVHLTVDEGVEISASARASIRLRSLLGQKYVAIDDSGRGELLADGAVIPLDRTTVPVDMGRFLDTLGSFAEPIDVDALNRFVASFGGALEGRGDELGELLDNVASLADVLAERADDLDRLLVAADRLLTAVDSRREELAVSVDQLSVVFGTLAERREDIEGLVVGLEGLSERLVPLLDENEQQLAELLDNVETVTGVLDEQRGRIDLALGQLADLGERFTDLTNDGPWVNVYFVGIVPGPFVANPVTVGEDGRLPTFWFDPPTPGDLEVGGTRIEWHDPEGPPPPEGWPGR